MIQYRYCYDEAFLVESLAQYRRQSKLYRWMIMTRAGAFISLAVLWALFQFGGFGPDVAPSAALPVLLPAAVLFTALLFLRRWLDAFLIKRRMRKSPLRGCEVQIEFTPDGMVSRTSKSQASMAWTMFTRATRVAAGFLLYSGPGVFFWLPDAALVQGTVQEVERLFAQRVRAGARADEGASA